MSIMVIVYELELDCETAIFIRLIVSLPSADLDLLLRSILMLGLNFDSHW